MSRYRKILGAKEGFVELVAAGITAYRSVVVADHARFKSSDGGGAQTLILTRSRRNRAFDRLCPAHPLRIPQSSFATALCGRGRSGVARFGSADPKFADPIRPYSLAYVP
jgi:hypothetical protein